MPTLAHLFDVLSNTSKLKTRRFSIELAADDEIRKAAPDSKLLKEAFNYVDDTNGNDAA